MPVKNTSYKIATYIDDFGNSHFDTGLIFGNNISVALLFNLGYGTKTSEGACSNTNLPFKRRTITGINKDTGESHSFPVPQRALATIQDFVTKLKEAGYICLNLSGESWSVLTPNALGSGSYSFRTTPYAIGDIPNVSDYESISFQYDSDLLPNQISLSTKIEKNPIALNTCQKAGLINPSTSGGGICSIASGFNLTPRKAFIKYSFYKSDDNPKNSQRQMILAYENLEQVRTALQSSSNCAYCYGYKGESARNIENLI